MSTEAYYLVKEQEARLLAAVLNGCGEDLHAADRILCDLIELGLADADQGPKVYRQWADCDPEDRYTQESLYNLYMDEDDDEDED